MRLDSNTILITGGGAGIGRGLAEALHALGNHVVIGGRREGVLREVCGANPGMSHVALDVADRRSIHAALETVTARFPDLNCLVNNAGIQRAHDFSVTGGVNDEAVEEEVWTNLVGLAWMCSAFLPLLTRRPEAAVINVSSGLAFVPLARFPIYCATKAAVHSFCVSLRHQLKDSSVKVIELIPPMVDTNLGQGRPRPARMAMPLAQFIAEAMEGLSGDADEVAVGNAKSLRAGAGDGEALRQAFSRMNP